MIFRCTECGCRVQEEEIPRFQDPASDMVWLICPQCRSAEHFENMCDEPGCHHVATCGWPSPDGYRRTCGVHWREVP